MKLMDAKKICIVIPYDYPVPAIKGGGAIETLITFLIEENELNHKFNFTILTTWDVALENANYKYTEFVYFKKNRILDIPWKYACRVIKKLFSVYVPDSYRMCLIFNYLKREKDKFDYLIYESGWSYNLPRLSKVFPKSKILNHLHWYGDGNDSIDNSFEYLLPVSSFIANQWKNRTGRDDDKIIVWKNCYNEKTFQMMSSEQEIVLLRKQLAIDINNKVILFVGRTIPEKGIKQLVQAVNLAKADNITLIIIGKANFGNGKITAYERELTLIIEESKIKIISLGFIPNHELYKYYELADICVIPSVFEDPAPLAVIEALSTGVPLITTRMGGIPEYVCDAAYLIDVTDKMVDDLAYAIDLLLENDELRQELSAKAKKRAELFTKRNYYQNLIDIIYSIER